MSQLTREAAAACTEIRRRMMSDIFVEVVMSDEPKKKYQLRILKFSPDLVESFTWYLWTCTARVRKPND